ncbi:MAG: phage tail protein [Bacteroidota bacterium]|nr:phage tail protein [Bacteroidota bacterium]
MYPYFIWKGISSLDKNIMVTKLPSLERPDANIEKIAIPGRNGHLTYDDGTYQGTIKPCECALYDGSIDDVSAWLTGSGDVIFSNAPDKVYKATIINKIPFSKIIPTFHNFIIQFDCQPHKYAIDNPTIALASPGTIFNPGTANSKPVVKVFGTGSIDLNINDNIIYLTNIVEYVTIDSELMDAYKDTQLMNNEMIGEFPELIPGSNSVNFSGNVSKIEITPNWRWL